MEKFQKYCLSVLLVIIYNNISSQVNNGSIEIDDCKKLYELYSKFLNAQGCEGTLEMSLSRIHGDYGTIGQKQSAVDVFTGQNAKRQGSGFYNFQPGIAGFGNEKYDRLLENFEKQSKEYNFAENIYFKSKVSKIRNKDYLDLIV